MIAFSPSASGMSIENVAVASLSVLVMMGDMTITSDLFAVVPWMAIVFASVSEPELGALSSRDGMTMGAGGAIVGTRVADTEAVGVLDWIACCLLIDMYTTPVATITPNTRPSTIAISDSLFIRYFDCTRKKDNLQVSGISSC